MNITRNSTNRRYVIGAILASVSVAGIGLLPTSPVAAQNNDETPFGTFSEICVLAGGTPSRNWPTTRLTCRFSDGSIVWCSPSMRRCGHTKAATSRRRAMRVLATQFAVRASL